MYRDNGLPFIPFRFWIGFWVMVALLVIVAFELSFLVRYIARFTEECFACLVSVIFIYEAFHKLADIMHHQPVHTGVVRESDPPPLCYCVPRSPEGDVNASTSHRLQALSGDVVFTIASVALLIAISFLSSFFLISGFYPEVHRLSADNWYRPIIGQFADNRYRPFYNRHRPIIGIGR